MFERLMNKIAILDNKRDSLVMTIVDIIMLISIGIVIGLAIGKTVGVHL